MWLDFLVVINLKLGNICVLEFSFYLELFGLVLSWVRVKGILLIFFRGLVTRVRVVSYLKVVGYLSSW